jgi:hyaluronoglucosaminidase
MHASLAGRRKFFMRMHITSHLGAVTAGAAILALGLAGAAIPATAGVPSPACRAHAMTAYVASDHAVTPVHVATNTAGRAISMDTYPVALAVTPDGKTLYAASDTAVTPVSTATGTVGKAITLSGGSTQVIAITPNGKALYALSVASGTLTPISTRTNRAGPPISIGDAGGLAVTPNGKAVYVVGSGGVTPIRTATNTAGALIPAGGSSITVTPNGKTAYVLAGGSTYQDAYVTPIRTATNRPGKPIPIPVDHAGSPWGTPGQVLIISTPDSKTVYAASPTSNKVTPISTATNRAGKPITVGMEPYAMAITPNGKTLVVVNQDGTVSLIRTATNRVTATISTGAPWTVWLTIRPLAITPDGRTAYVVNYKANTVTPISLPAGKAGKPITVGNRPVAVVTSPAPPAHR